MKLLYLIRTEADFERALSIAIAGKRDYVQSFVFVGDFSPFHQYGIKNKFQQELFHLHGFKMRDFGEYSILGGMLRIFPVKLGYELDALTSKSRRLLFYFFNLLYVTYLKFAEEQIISRIFRKEKPDAFLSDQSMTKDDYRPEKFRKAAFRLGTPSFIYTHGAAGGLHRAFSEPTFDPYSDYFVFSCNKFETDPKFTNRILLGDMSSSYPYVRYMNSLDMEEITHLNDRKYKVAFMVPGTGPYTSTTGWHAMEEIIIDLSENSDVAMILKLHPREAPFIDLRMLRTFANLKIVGNDCDRSRVTKWANIVVCGDHCSTIFEPMILGKKVVAIEGHHLPTYKSCHSPLSESSVNYISHAYQFRLDSLREADPLDSVTNRICWGEQGNVDLAQLFLSKVASLTSERFKRPNTLV